ncbi:hypothetical protein B0H17DRAFT_1144287 [Mycena rosella]|uniref:Uncharacterized protein n=1 Tax=Mycena rosella TaxID=1033263 RepID=A0AAD7G3K6_MYCRO|nr:hypothetical protein B0H17DRAFT_1144287 [Mycena rosella]
MGRKLLAQEVKAERRRVSPQICQEVRYINPISAILLMSGQECHRGVLAPADDTILKQMKTSALSSAAAYHERWAFHPTFPGGVLLTPRNRTTIRDDAQSTGLEAFKEKNSQKYLAKTQHATQPQPHPQILPKKLPKGKSNKRSPSPSHEGSDGDEGSEDEACVATPPTPRAVFFERVAQRCCPQGCGDQYCEGCQCICPVEGAPRWHTCNHAAPGPPSVNRLANSVAATVILNCANYPEMGHNELQNRAHDGSAPTPSCAALRLLVQSLLRHISSLPTALGDLLPDAANLEERAALADLKRLLANSEADNIAARVSALDVVRIVADREHAKVFTADGAHAKIFAACHCVVLHNFEGDSDPMTPHEDLEYTADLAVYEELNARHRAHQRLRWDERQELVSQLGDLAAQVPHSWAANIQRHISLSGIAHCACCRAPHPISDEPPLLPTPYVSDDENDPADCLTDSLTDGGDDYASNLLPNALDQVKRICAKQRKLRVALGALRM